MKSTFIFLLIALIISVSGCCSINNRDEFEGGKDYLVGRELSNPMFNYYVKQSTARTPKKDGNVEYVFSKDKCEYSMLINEETQVVKSWAYISDPKNCIESDCKIR